MNILPRDSQDGSTR